MADATGIEWADATWNPFTGCTRLTPGCDHCYMFRAWPRLRAMGVPGYEGDPGTLRVHLDRLDVPIRWKRSRRIFVCSMSDLFHSHAPDQAIADVFDTMRSAPQHVYLVLTKRANRVRRWVEWYRLHRAGLDWQWPAHVWLGTSVESADLLPRIERIDGVAPITFVSAEPLLGPLCGDTGYPERDFAAKTSAMGGLEVFLPGLDWVIVGGESGPGARLMDVEWVRDIRDACLDYEVFFFFKQWGGRTPGAGGRQLDGRTWDETPALPGGDAGSSPIPGSA